MFRRSRFSLGASSVKGVFVVLIGFAFIFAGLNGVTGYATVYEQAGQFWVWGWGLTDATLHNPSTLSTSGTGTLTITFTYGKSGDNSDMSIANTIKTQVNGATVDTLTFSRNDLVLDVDRYWSASPKVITLTDVAANPSVLFITTTNLGGSGMKDLTIDFVEDDVTAPSFTHTAITAGTSGSDVVINADITDAVGVSSATLKYRLVGGDSFTDVSMSVTSGDTYSGTIPGSAVTADLEYYIVAVDSIPNTGYSPGPDALTYNTITVTAPTTTTAAPVVTTSPPTTSPPATTAPPSNNIVTTTTLSLCGNGICEVVETNAICSSDCPYVVSESTTTTTPPTTNDTGVGDNTTTVEVTTTTIDEDDATEDIARSAIDEAALFIEDSRTLGASEEKIGEAETVLAEAQSAFGLGDYQLAINKSDEAKEVLTIEDMTEEPGLDFTTIGVVLLVILVLGAGGIYYTMQQEKSGKRK